MTVPVTIKHEKDPGLISPIPTTYGSFQGRPSRNLFISLAGDRTASEARHSKNPRGTARATPLFFRRLLALAQSSRMTWFWKDSGSTSLSLRIARHSLVPRSWRTRPSVPVVKHPAPAERSDSPDAFLRWRSKRTKV